MQKTNGQWYTDKNGNHYFVENGQSPKEGWEASKRRKMISKGKYNVSEDGENYKEVSKDDYDKYEADETEFDETVDDDFGFDEEENNNYIDKLKSSYKELDRAGLRYNVEGGHYEFVTEDDAKKAYKMLMDKFGNQNVTIDGFDVNVYPSDDEDDFSFDDEESINSKAGTLQDGVEKPSNLKDYLLNEGMSESFANGIREAALNGKESLENYLAEEGISTSYTEDLYDIVKNEEDEDLTDAVVDKVDEEYNEEEAARKLVNMAKRDGHRLTMKEAREVLDQSYDEKLSLEDFYNWLQFDDEEAEERYNEEQARKVVDSAKKDGYNLTMEEAKALLERSRYKDDNEENNGWAAAKKLVDMARKDGHKLKYKDAKELLDQSYNGKGSLEDFYSQLTFDDEEASNNWKDTYKTAIQEMRENRGMDDAAIRKELKNSAGLSDENINELMGNNINIPDRENRKFNFSSKFGTPSRINRVNDMLDELLANGYAQESNTIQGMTLQYLRDMGVNAVSDPSGGVTIPELKNKQEEKKPPMTKEQRQAIRDQINKMIASLDDARSIDEAWDIEEGIKELEDMLNKYKGKK